MKNILFILFVSSIFACNKSDFISSGLKIKIVNKTNKIKKVGVFLVNNKDVLSDSIFLETKPLRKKTLKWKKSNHYSQGQILISIDDGEKNI